MRRKRSDDGDDVLRDGEVLRVPLMLRDGSTVDVEPWQRDVIVGARFGLEDGDVSLHRPGFRFCDAAGDEAKAKGYLQAQQEMCDAWKGDAYGAYPAGSGAKEGGECTIDGRPGRLSRQSDGSFVCVPTGNTDAKMDVRDAAYAEMCRSLQDAWRGGK